MAKDQIWISPTTTVEIASNLFARVETILQVDDQRIIYLTDSVGTDRSLAIELFSPDGERVAISKGARLYLTHAGEKMGLSVRREPGLWACEGGGRTLYEARFKSPASLAIEAELYSPSGKLLRIASSKSQIVELKPSALQIFDAMPMRGNKFVDQKTGIHIITTPGIQPVAGTAIVLALAGSGQPPEE
jgi:hypothetical protein